MKYIRLVTLAIIPLIGLAGFLALKLEKRHEAIVAMVMLRDDRTFIAGSMLGSIHIGDIHQLHEIRKFPLRAEQLWSLALSESERLCAIGCFDGRVQVIALHEQRLVASFTSHAGPVTSLGFSKNEASLFSGGWDKRIVCQDLHDGSVRFELGGLPECVVGVGLLDGENALAVICSSGDLVLYQLAAKTQRVTRVAAPLITCCAFSVMGTKVAFGTDAGRVFILDLEKVQKVREIVRHGKAVSAICFSADGSLIVSTAPSRIHGNPPELFIYDGRTGRCLSIPNRHSGPLSALLLTHDASLMVSGLDVSD